MEEMVTFCGCQERGADQEPILLVNDPEGNTVTYDPKKHVLVGDGSKAMTIIACVLFVAGVVGSICLACFLATPCAW